MLNWNVRGINDFSKAAPIRELLMKHNTEIVAFTETRLLDTTYSKLATLWGNTAFHYRACKASENGGRGVVLMWNPDFHEVTEAFQGLKWILVIGKLLLYDWDCIIRVVYGGYSVEQQVEIYNEVSVILSRIQKPTMLMGDYNQILEVSERRSQLVDTIGMRTFREWVNKHALVDLPLSDRHFTWSRGNSRSKIDKVLCQPEWIVKFSSILLISDTKTV